MSHFDDNEDEVIYGRRPVHDWQRGEEDPEPPGTATCKRCGKEGLLWLPPWDWDNPTDKWMLAEAQEEGTARHVCHLEPPEADFTVVGVEE